MNMKKEIMFKIRQAHFLAMLELIMVLFALPSAAFTGSVLLSWDPPIEGNPAGYKVYYQANTSSPPFNGTGATEGGSPIDVANTTTATVNGLDPDSTYFFAITAYNTAGLESVYSNIVVIPFKSINATIWPGSTVPGIVDAGPDGAVELGVKFRADSSGYITGIRFFKASTNIGTHIGNLWTSDGALLATATFTGETDSGWQQVNFSTPVAVTANTVYVASYFSIGGHYSIDQNYFASMGVDSPPLHALADGATGVNGVYTYGSTSSFPNQGWNDSNYWVDVVFSTVAAPPVAQQASSTIWPGSTVPGIVDAGPDGAVELGVKFRADSSGYITGIRFFKASTNIGTHIGNLWTSDGALLATATFTGETDSGWQQVNFSTPVAVTANTVYVASYFSIGGHYSIDQNYFASMGVDSPPLHALADGATGVNGVYTYGSTSSFPNQGWNDSNYWVDVVFSTVAAPPVAQQASSTIWPGSTVPGIVDAGPDGAVELGVKFRADSSGYITGIRFFKASTNIGTHIGNLWTSDGALLATATFTGETDSGWQQVNFSTPVAVTANTVYVASYFSIGGHYSIDQNYFASMGVDSPPLHALADGATGVNGVYTYGSTSSFPNQGWNNSNYWVDVVFSASATSMFSSNGANSTFSP